MIEPSDVRARLSMMALDAVKNKMVDDLLDAAAREEAAADVHKQLAAGYEVTGVAESQEIRELMRANYHQNQAIIYCNAAMVLILTESTM